MECVITAFESGSTPRGIVIGMLVEVATIMRPGSDSGGLWEREISVL
jgi:hypothetical protein